MNFASLCTAFRKAANEETYVIRKDQGNYVISEDKDLLSEIFEQTANYLNNTKNLNLNSVHNLLNNAKIIYARYVENTEGWFSISSWHRFILKFFSKKFDEAEAKTRLAYMRLTEIQTVLNKEELIKKHIEIFEKSYVPFWITLPQEIPPDDRKTINAKTLPYLVEKFKKQFPDHYAKVRIPKHCFCLKITNAEVFINSLKFNNGQKEPFIIKLEELDIINSKDTVFTALCTYLENFTLPEMENWTVEQKKHLSLIANSINLKEIKTLQEFCETSLNQ